MKFEIGFERADFSDIDDSYYAMGGGDVSECGYIADDNKTIYIVSDNSANEEEYKYLWKENDTDEYHNFPYESDKLKLSLLNSPQNGYETLKVLLEIKEEK